MTCINIHYHIVLHFAALSDQECAVGFLDERSLQTIVDVPNDRSTDDHPSIFTYGTPQPATLSMPLNQSGTLKKLIAAAEFDVTVSAGWPELQIIRNAAIVFSTGIREPKPTGYLNVYKYDDVSADMFEIKAGDVLGISWHTNALNPNLNRFSLAYYNYTGILSSDIPIVSIVVGDCDPEADLLTLDTLYCEEPTDSTTMSTRTKSQEFNLITISTSVVISVVVSCSLLLSIVIVIMFVVCQHTENK